MSYVRNVRLEELIDWLLDQGLDLGLTDIDDLAQKLIDKFDIRTVAVNP